MNDITGSDLTYISLLGKKKREKQEERKIIRKEKEQQRIRVLYYAILYIVRFFLNILTHIYIFLIQVYHLLQVLTVIP